MRGLISAAVTRHKADLAASGGAARVGYGPPSTTGAPVTTVEERLNRMSRRHFHLEEYGGLEATPTAVKDAFDRIFAEATTQTIEIDIGDYGYTLNADVILPVARRVAIHGRGSINCAGGGIVRNVHDQFLALHGMKFTGAYPAFKFAAAATAGAYREYELTGVEFAMGAGVWAVNLNGAREGIIDKSYFRSGKGVYRTLSNICYVSKSFFLGLEHAIHDDGKGSGFSCGINIKDSEILGCGRSVVVQQCDDGEISGCTIDYNDEGIRLIGQDGFKITGGYLGTRTAQGATPNVAVGGVTPAISVLSDVAVKSEKIQIVGATLTGHHEANLQYDNIYLENVAGALIADCVLTFYTRNAVRYGANVTYLNVHDCATANRGGTGVNAFECISTDDSSNKIHDNSLNPGQGIVAPLANIRSNIGYVTSNRGEAIAGTGVTSVSVALSLPYTPDKKDVRLTPTNADAARALPYISAISATQLDIGFLNATVAPAGVSYVIDKHNLAG